MNGDNIVQGELTHEDVYNFQQTKVYENGERDHSDDLKRVNGVIDNPKADTLYGHAWRLGHAYGYSEVGSHFNELVDLIK